MEEEGFEDIGEYILKRHNTIAQYIATRPIMDLCKKMVRRPGGWVSQRWWVKEGIYIAGTRAQAVAEAAEEEDI